MSVKQSQQSIKNRSSVYKHPQEVIAVELAAVFPSADHILSTLGGAHLKHKGARADFSKPALPSFFTRSLVPYCVQTQKASREHPLGHHVAVIIDLGMCMQALQKGMGTYHNVSHGWLDEALPQPCVPIVLSQPVLELMHSPHVPIGSDVICRG